MHGAISGGFVWEASLKFVGADLRICLSFTTPTLDWFEFSEWHWTLDLLRCRGN